jgi:hypothetical protein
MFTYVACFQQHGGVLLTLTSDFGLTLPRRPSRLILALSGRNGRNSNPASGLENPESEFSVQAAT